MTGVGAGPESWRATLLEKHLRIGAITEGGVGTASIAEPSISKAECRIGRPTKLSEGTANAMLQMIEECIPLTSICSLLGFHRTTLWRWRKHYPGFDVMIQQALGPRPLDSHPEFRNARKRQRTLTRKRTVQPPRKYRPELCEFVGPSLRQTARAIGVHWITVHRWTRMHLEFDIAQAFQREVRAQHRLELEAAGLLEWMEAIHG